jgi:hypothetical protein
VQLDSLYLLTTIWGPYLTIWVVSLSATDLITRSLTAQKHLTGIRSLSGVGTVVTALALSVLYLRKTLNGR